MHIHNKEQNVSSQRQLGWNCFDIAAAIPSRDEFVRFALKQSHDAYFRNLLAPEIRHAAALAAVSMNQQAVDNERINQKIVKLFILAEQSTNSKVIHQANEQINVLLNGNQYDATLERYALPETMRDDNVNNLINNYLNAHEIVRRAAEKFNKTTGLNLSRTQLDEFVPGVGNRDLDQDAFMEYQKIKNAENQAKTELDDYCNAEATYRSYVSDYYGQQGWFAFQRSFSGETNTSMVDVAAIFLNKQIIIKQNNEIIYQTNNMATVKVEIIYNGYGHFTRDFPEPSIYKRMTIRRQAESNINAQSTTQDLQYLELTINDQLLTITVPCKRRAQCYVKELEVIYQKLITGILFPLQNNLLSALKPLIENFIRVLDQQVMEFLSREFKQYRTSNAIKTDITKEQAIIHYERYFRENPTFDTTMRKKYKELAEVNDQLTANFITATLRALRRIANDFEILKRGFLKSTSAHVYLKEVNSSGNDFHKQGQQVLFFTLEDSSGDTVKIVYKPSSVQPDTLLFGDTKRLKSINNHYKSHYEDHFSLIELLNDDLGARHLKTYLIIPCQDANSDQFDKHYGYMEHLSHQPWEHSDYHNTIVETLKQIHPKLRETSPEPQNKVDQIFETLLRKAALDPMCDYIATNENEVAQYSYDCGVFLALMTIVKMNDGHCQNFIIVLKRLLGIDGELCFAQPMQELNNTLVFDYDAGAFNKNSTIEEVYYYLFDITGKQSVAIRHLEKNRLFHLYKLEQDMLIACSPDINLLIESFKKAIDIFQKQRDRLEKWFQLPRLKDMIIRVGLYATGAFNDEMLDLMAIDFNPEAWEQIRQHRLVTGYENYQEDLKPQAGKSPFLAIPQPSFAIYYSQNNNILNEYKSLNIPVHYAIASDTKLYDGYGQVVHVPIGPLSNIIGDDFAADTEFTDEFFMQSPLVSTHQHAMRLLNQPDLISKLVNEIQALAPILQYSNSETPGLLIEVPLRVPPEDTTTTSRSIDPDIETYDNSCTCNIS